jgi:OmpA-OmpF porin, OOP family
MRSLRSLAWLLVVTAPLAWPGGPGITAESLSTATQPEILLTLGADGALTATGPLPQGLSPEALSAALPGVNLAGIDQAGPAQAWEAGPGLEALSIVLPRFRTATVRLGDRTLAIEGELESGLSAAGAQAALRAALGAGWHLDLALTETAPPAELVLSQTGEGVAVSGLLPDELSPPEALELIGTPASDFGLAGGGAGGTPGWSGALAALGETLDLFVSATGRVTAGEVAVQGVLRPGYPSDTVADRLDARLPDGWMARLAAEETTPSEGDRRVSLDTGEPESFRRGFWLPDVGFPVSTERCRAEVDAALGGERLPFVDGGAQIEEQGIALLNRLAAIAVRCLNSSSLRLDIGAHTDSVGNDAENEALSQARAAAVRQALLERGVRPEAVTARGYGESRPVATNNTPAGRAENRRIAFDWSGPEG